LLLLTAQLVEREMRARAFQSVVLDDLSRLLAVREAGKLAIPRRTQLDNSDAQIGETLAQSRKVAILDALPMRIRLASDWQSERTGRQHTRGQDRRRGCLQYGSS